MANSSLVNEEPIWLDFWTISNNNVDVALTNEQSPFSPYLLHKKDSSDLRGHRNDPSHRSCSYSIEVFLENNDYTKNLHSECFLLLMVEYVFPDKKM